MYPSSMEKRKINSASYSESRRRKSEETVSTQSWRKKRKDEYYDGRRDRKETIYWSQRVIKREDTRQRHGRRRDDASSWKRSERGSNKRRRGEVVEYLNHDVLEQVMLRLPVKSLIRFQIVSKHWRCTITSKFFREKYTLHQKTQEPKVICLSSSCYHELVPGSTESRYKRNITLKTMKLEWSSTCLVEEDEYHMSDDYFATPSKSIDGLVCFYPKVDMYARKIKVINPATRWSYKLPLANIQIKSYYLKYMNDKQVIHLPGFGKDYVTGTYKLVWLYNINNNNNNPLACEVFDFGIKRWRKVIPPHSDHRLNYTNLPNFVNGWLYWFHQDVTKIIAFDLHKEMFQVVPNPIIETQSSSVLDMHIEDDRRGFLWASETSGDGMQHVWRLTNHNTGGALLKMDKMFSIDLNKLTSTCFDHSNNTSLFYIEAMSKNSNKIMEFLSLPHFCRRGSSGSSHHIQSVNCLFIDHHFHPRLYNYVKHHYETQGQAKPANQGSFQVGFPQREPDHVEIAKTIESELHKFENCNGLARPICDKK